MNALLLQLPVYDYLIIICVIIYVAKCGFFREITGNSLKIITKNKLWMILFVIVTVLLVSYVDFPVTHFFATHRTHALEVIQTIGNTIGNGKFLYPMLATLVVISVLFNSEKSKFFITCKMSFTSCVFGGIFVLIVKSIVERQRPFVTFNPFHFFDYSTAISTHCLFGFNYASFPSGHAIVASSAIVVFAYSYRKNLVGKLLWLYPLIVGVARVYSLNHWTSDVFVGILCGSIIAIATYKANAKKLRMERFNG
ncbi:MAG: phosphatase PAP2 family protein [Fusobacteria bacterium]|nr:phosphatase PAP2 family protein [Fusobacteriota bacterium]